MELERQQRERDGGIDAGAVVWFREWVGVAWQWVMY